MLEKLHIHRFRGIREGTIENFSQINLLVGPNNSGKTALLEMLYLASLSGRPIALTSDQLYAEDPSIPIIPQGSIPLSTDFLGYTPWSRLWQRHGQKPEWAENHGFLTESNALVFQIKQLPNHHPLHTFRLIPPLSDDVTNYGGFTKNDIPVTASFTLSVNPDFPKSLIPDPFGDVFLEQPRSQLTYSWYPHFIYRNNRTENTFPLAVWAVQGTLPHPEHILFFDFHATDDHFTSEFQRNAYYLIPGWYEKIMDSFGRVFPDLAHHRLEILDLVERNKYTAHLRKEDQLPLTIDSFGDGARHAFKLLTALVTLREKITPDKPGLLLWEDPELFMHPSALQTLLAEVVRLIANQPIQLFISTHDLEVMATYVNLIQKGSLAENSLHVFRLGRQQNDFISVRFRYENLQGWLESGRDPRFWGLSNTLLRYSLEGQHE